jgi:hypothetical protein
VVWCEEKSCSEVLRKNDCVCVCACVCSKMIFLPLPSQGTTPQTLSWKFLQKHERRKRNVSKINWNYKIF